MILDAAETVLVFLDLIGLFTAFLKRIMGEGNGDGMKN